MENRNLTCIGCPLGCQLTVEMDGVDVKAVSGNSCKRGAEYGRKEVTNPTRIVTSSVRLMDGEADVVPVKTESDIPKDKIFDVIKELKNITLSAPVYIGNIVCENVAGTGVNVLATGNVLKQI